jgi:hypothetical protein
MHKMKVIHWKPTRKTWKEAKNTEIIRIPNILQGKTERNWLE